MTYVWLFVLMTAAVVWVLFKIAEKQAGTTMPVVTVEFRMLTSPVPEYSGEGYCYRWPFDRDPQVGDRLIVPTSYGSSVAVVVHCGQAPGVAGAQFDEAVQLIEPDEFEAVHEQFVADLNAWLDLARKRAKLPVGRDVKGDPPERFGPIPPRSGRATAVSARKHGNRWWWAYRQAQELRRDAEEIEEFQDIAREWYELADELGG